MRAFMQILVVGSALSAFALSPSIANGPKIVKAGPNDIRIEYVLENGPAIVTMDLVTNGIPIGAEKLWNATGAVNKVVQNGANVVHWPMRDALGETGLQRAKAILTAWRTDAPPDYLVLDLSKSSDAARWYATTNDFPGGFTDWTYKTNHMVFKRIPAAGVTWTMGRMPRETVSAVLTAKSHPVTLTHDFYMAIYPVTKGQYRLFKPTHTGNFSLSSDPAWLARPAESIGFCEMRGSLSNADSPGNSWPGVAVGHASRHDVDDDSFCAWIRAKTAGALRVDLPTEAQWEFACRAGCVTELYNNTRVTNSVSDANVGALGRYSKNEGYTVSEGSENYGVAERNWTSANGSSEVGIYPPNGFGLYDMCGNVWEVCLDAAYSMSSDAAVVDPVGCEQSQANHDGEGRVRRIKRGGCYKTDARYCTVSCRDSCAYTESGPSLGARLMCPIGGEIGD